MCHNHHSIFTLSNVNSHSLVSNAQLIIHISSTVSKMSFSRGVESLNLQFPAARLIVKKNEKGQLAEKKAQETVTSGILREEFIERIRHVSWI